MLYRANQFLSEIISNEKQITDILTNTFFRKRYGLSQFAVGSYCIDATKGTRDHTDKNIYSAFLQIAERHSKAFEEFRDKVNRCKMGKIELIGIEGLRDRISQIWHGKADDRFLFLPPSLSLSDALELCEYKDTVVSNAPQSQKSANSLVLIYIHNFKYEEIQENPDLIKKYNAAILSNVFITIDGVLVFNNRESIFEACVKETFGQCNDNYAKQITRKTNTVYLIQYRSRFSLYESFKWSHFEFSGLNSKKL